MQQGILLRMLGHDMLVECMRRLTRTAGASRQTLGGDDMDADNDEDDDDAPAGGVAASCRALLHATLGSGAARLRLELGSADNAWCTR